MSKPSAADLPRVMPFKRAAIESGFSYTSLRDAHFRGELAVILVGRAWYIEIAELVRYVEAQTRRGGARRGGA